MPEDGQTVGISIAPSLAQKHLSSRVERELVAKQEPGRSTEWVDQGTVPDTASTALDLYHCTHHFVGADRYQGSHSSKCWRSTR
jgi:hypothetical protein